MRKNISLVALFVFGLVSFVGCTSQHDATDLQTITTLQQSVTAKDQKIIDLTSEKTAAVADKAMLIAERDALKLKVNELEQQNVDLRKTNAQLQILVDRSIPPAAPAKEKTRVLVENLEAGSELIMGIGKEGVGALKRTDHSSPPIIYAIDADVSGAQLRPIPPNSPIQRQ